MQREQMLEQAKQTVCHDRNTQYGEPEDNFKVIAELWTAYLFGKSKANGGKFSLGPDDVASMMILFKVARNSSTPKEDRKSVV